MSSGNEKSGAAKDVSVGENGSPADLRVLANPGNSVIPISAISSGISSSLALVDPDPRAKVVEKLMREFPDLALGIENLRGKLDALNDEIRVARAFGLSREKIDELLEKKRTCSKTIELAKAIRRNSSVEEIEALGLSLEKEKVKAELFKMGEEEQYTEAGYLLQIRRTELDLALARFSGADAKEIAFQEQYLFRLRKIMELIRRVSGFDPSGFRKFMSKMSAEEFEDGLNFYAIELPLCREKLMKTGLKMAAEDIDNLELNYSRVDGSPLKTLMERKIFFEKMSALSELDLEYFRTRPETGFPRLEINESDVDAPIELKDAEQFYRLKDFTADYIFKKVLPSLIKNGADLRDVFREIHVWQMRGSADQLLRIDELDICADLRKENVCVSGYVAPPYDEVPDLMDAFAKQLKMFCDELGGKRTAMSKDNYEEAVIKLALYAQQRMVDIHPMANGNGRLARSIYEYVVLLLLGKGYSFCRLPGGIHAGGDPTLSGEFMGLVVRMSSRDFPRTNNAIANYFALNKLLSANSLNLVLNDQLISDYANRLRTGKIN